MWKIHWRFIVLCLLIIILIYFRFYHGQIQQDNYLGYAASLHNGLKDISFFDSRLFPGLPIIINVMGGYFAVFSAFIGSYIILYKLTKSPYAFLPLVFPPVMLAQSTLIATEIPAIFLILLSVYFFKNKNFALALVLSGIGFWIRAIAIIPGLVIFTYLLITEWQKAIKYLPYLIFPVLLLALFNSHFSG